MRREGARGRAARELPDARLKKLGAALCRPRPLHALPGARAPLPRPATHAQQWRWPLSSTLGRAGAPAQGRATRGRAAGKPPLPPLSPTAPFCVVGQRGARGARAEAGRTSPAAHSVTRRGRQGRPDTSLAWWQARLAPHPARAATPPGSARRARREKKRGEGEARSLMAAEPGGKLPPRAGLARSRLPAHARPGWDRGRQPRPGRVTGPGGGAGGRGEPRRGKKGARRSKEKKNGAPSLSLAPRLPMPVPAGAPPAPTLPPPLPTPATHTLPPLPSSPNAPGRRSRCSGRSSAW